MKKLAIILLLSTTLTGFLTAIDFSKPKPANTAKAVVDESATLKACAAVDLTKFAAGSLAATSVKFAADGNKITITYNGGTTYVFDYKRVMSVSKAGYGPSETPVTDYKYYWTYGITIKSATKYIAIEAVNPATFAAHTASFAAIMDKNEDASEAFWPYSNTTDTNFDSFATKTNTGAQTFTCTPGFDPTKDNNFENLYLDKPAGDNNRPFIIIGASPASSGLNRPELTFKLETVVLIPSAGYLNDIYFYFVPTDPKYNLYAVRLNWVGSQACIVEMTDADQRGTEVTCALHFKADSGIYPNLVQWVYNEKATTSGVKCGDLVGPGLGKTKSTWTGASTDETPYTACININGLDVTVNGKEHKAGESGAGWLASWGIKAYASELPSTSKDVVTNECGSTGYFPSINDRMRVGFCNLALGLHELARDFVQTAVDFFARVIGVATDF